MISYPGTPGTIELLGPKDTVKTIGRECNTLTRYYRYHLSRPVEKPRYYLSDLFQKEVLCTVFRQEKKEKNSAAWAKQESLNSKHRDNNFWKNKLARKKMERWILKPQLLRAVLLLFPLVSCASTAIPFLGPLSSSAVLDVNISERIRETKKEKLRLSEERETHGRLRMFTLSNEFKNRLISVTRNVMAFTYHGN